MGIRPSVKFICGINNLEYDGFTITDRRWQPATPMAQPDFGEILDRVALPDDRHPDPEDKKAVAEFFDSHAFYTWLHNTTIKAALTESNGQAKKWYKIIQYDSEYGAGNVIGYIIDEVANGSSMAYALIPFLEGQASLMGAEAGFREIEPVRDADQLHFTDRLNYWLCEKAKTAPEMKTKGYWQGNETYGDGTTKKIKTLSEMNRFKTLWKNGWLYPFFAEEMRLKFAPVTAYLFNQMGLKVPMRDLKLMLYWQWS